MPQHHHYRNDGTGRDLYVNRGVVNPIQGNVEARFDTLPSNVRGYLKEQVKIVRTAVLRGSGRMRAL